LKDSSNEDDKLIFKMLLEIHDELLIWITRHEHEIEKTRSSNDSSSKAFANPSLSDENRANLKKQRTKIHSGDH
jgi:hypothetical protein